MKENIFKDDFDSNFISAFEEFIEIFLSLEMMKNELVEKLLGLARELNLTISREQILLIFEKLKFHKNKGQHRPISFNGSYDEMTSDAEGPWWFYLNKENQNNEEPI